MRVLYVAAGIPVPGTVGGSTHVREVSRGLAALGHEVLVIAGPPRRRDAAPAIEIAAKGSLRLATKSACADWARDPVPTRGGGFRGERSEPLAAVSTAGAAAVVTVALPKALALGLYPVVARRAAAFRPDVVMERYYNFAGAGLLYARWHSLGGVLEVNAPLYDPPGSPKDRLDRALGRPLRCWAAWQARAAGRIVTPLATTVGRLAPAEKIVELPWGANTDLFDPARVGPGERADVRRELGIPDDARVVAFAGSFRPWHGVGALLAALRELLPRDPDLWALLLGDGPERPGLERAARGWGAAGRRVVFAGRRPYDEVPRYLAAADVGAAPFEPARHPALRHFGFYWSPLKVFEYGAMALPVVCPDLPPLNQIVRDGREGRLYREGDPAALAAALAALLGDGAGRRALGAAARERVVRHYSWMAHCRALAETLRCAAR
ncbi:MAG TPA: glycosyltransferase [Thermomicrobiales bacterium]|nr:glycosyltransferase [Thermomicrobiales bacterium]